MNEECSSQCGGSVYDAARPGDEHWTTTKHNEFLSSYTETPGPPGRGDHWPALRPAGGGGGWVLRWGEGVFIGFQFSSPQPPAQAVGQARQQQTPHIRNQSPLHWSSGPPAGTACPGRTVTQHHHTLGAQLGADTQEGSTSHPPHTVYSLKRRLNEGSQRFNNHGEGPNFMSTYRE